MAKKKITEVGNVDVNTEVTTIDTIKFNESFGRTFTQTYQALGLSQQQLHNMTGKAVGFINNVAQGRTSPSIAFMTNLLGMSPFREHSLMIDDFVSGDAPDIVSDSVSTNNAEFTRKDMIGAYIVYLFDQSKENYTKNEQASRRIRYGVISIVEGVNVGYGVNSSFKAFGHFFKEKGDAIKLHKTLSKIFKVTLKGTKIDIPKLAEDIENEYKKVGVKPTDSNFAKYINKEYYKGEVDFQEQHVYVDLKSSYFGDHALFALYSPPKKKDAKYIGGVASLSSVSHGNDRMPCAQKALVSRYVINKDDVELGEYIRMNSTKVSLEKRIEEIYSMFEELNNESLSSLIDRKDKLSIFSNRFERIIEEYIKDSLNSVGVISASDDSAAYELIKHFGMHND